jgi:GNAT superfamily N-acetyltransferase
MAIGRCACGWRASDIALMRQAHGAWHVRWTNGPLVTADARHVLAANGWRATLPRILRVDPRAAAPFRHIAYRAAHLLQRENGDDVVMFPQQRLAAKRPTAYLWLEAERALGLVLLTDTQRWGWLNERGDDGPVHLAPADSRPLVSGVWVAGGHRRQGIASRLIERAADLERVAVDEMVWATPFTDAGLALARSLMRSDRIRVG